MEAYHLLIIIVIVILLVWYWQNSGEGYEVGGLYVSNGDNVGDSAGNIYRMEYGVLRKFADKDLWDSQPNKIVKYVYSEKLLEQYPRGFDISKDSVPNLTIDSAVLKSDLTGLLYVIKHDPMGYYAKWQISPNTWVKFIQRPFVVVSDSLLKKIPGNAFWLGTQY